MAGDNEAGAKLRSIRYDPKLVEKFRRAAIAKIHNLEKEELEPQEEALVPVLDDDEFKDTWGPFFERCSNEKVIRLALETLLDVVAEAPPGRTGVREIDEDRKFGSVEALERFSRSED